MSKKARIAACPHGRVRAACLGELLVEDGTFAVIGSNGLAHQTDLLNDLRGFTHPADTWFCSGWTLQWGTEVGVLVVLPRDTGDLRNLRKVAKNWSQTTILYASYGFAWFWDVQAKKRDELTGAGVLRLLPNDVPSEYFVRQGIPFTRVQGLDVTFTADFTAEENKNALVSSNIKAITGANQPHNSIQISSNKDGGTSQGARIAA